MSRSIDPVADADASATSGRPPIARGAGFSTTATCSARRTILQFFRTPQVLVMGTVQGAMFLVMFRYVFGGAIRTGGELSYVNFLVPGFLTTIVLWTGMSAASGVAEDAATGVHDRLRSLPIPRVAVVVGRALADTGLTTWGLFVTGILSFLIGFRPAGSVVHVAAGFVLIIVAGFAFSWVFILIGLVGGNAQAAQGLSMLVIPFSFISSANVPVQSMPGWLQPFAANQPVSVVINAVRSLMQGGPARVGIGHTTAYWVAAALIWCAVLVVVFAPLCARRFARTH
ncbi:MAG: ABC transporter permease [Actinobacteria bacterium]|nr:ABC transporter permease [Actinomycetota bacterium]